MVLGLDWLFLSLLSPYCQICIGSIGTFCNSKCILNYLLILNIHLQLEAKESCYMIFVLFIAMISMRICKIFSKIRTSMMKYTDYP